MRTLAKISILTVVLALACTLALAQKKYDFSAEGEDLSVPGETVQQAGDQAAKALTQAKMKPTISTVGFDIPAGSEAEKTLQETAQIGGGAYFTANDAGQLSAALGAAASGQVVAAAAPDTVVLTAPKNGDVAGPSIDLVGKAPPGQLIVVFTNVYDADTGDKLRTVAGIRNRASVTGDFTFRIATPRLSFGAVQAPPALRYELHAYIARADGTTGPETIVNVTAPKP